MPATVTSGSILDRPLWDAVLGQVTTGNDVLALTEGALNLLDKAELLLLNGPPESHARALILIERATQRLDEIGDVEQQAELRDHVKRMRELVRDLRARAEERT